MILILKIIGLIVWNIWWFCIRDKLKCIQKVKIFQDMTEDDYELTCLELICKVNSMSRSFGIVVFLLALIRIYFIQNSRMPLLGIIVAVIILLLNVLKDVRIRNLLSTALVYERSRDYYFVNFFEWILRKGRSEILPDEGGEVVEIDYDQCKALHKEGILKTKVDLIFEICLFYLFIFFM